MGHVCNSARLEGYFAAYTTSAQFAWMGRYPWQLIRYDKGEYLCRSQEPVDHLILLFEGTVMVSLTTPHGRTHLLTYCRPPSLVCGDVEVALGNTLATADLRAHNGPIWCAAIPLAQYRQALLCDLDFLRYGFRRLAREMVKDSIYASNNLLFPLEDRLAAYILETAPGGVFQENLTRTAELLGVSYRQLSRVLKSFLESGWLEKTKRGWHIIDRPALSAQGAAILPLDVPDV